jgi:hypothetical protein
MLHGSETGVEVALQLTDFGMQMVGAKYLRQHPVATSEEVAARIQDAVVGGLAVSTWAEPRLTRDADLAVSVVDDTDAELLVGALQGSSFRLRASATS